MYTKKCTLKETPNKVNQKEGNSILVYLKDDKRFEDIELTSIRDVKPAWRNL